MFIRMWSISLALLIASSMVLADEGKELYEAWSRGMKAVANGNYATAKKEYSEVINLARQQKLPAAQLSEFLFSAGQATALACDMPGAEKAFSESLELAMNEEKKDSGGTLKEKNIFPATWKLFELAHFYSDRGLYEKAYPYWHEFIPRYKILNSTAAQDPIAYSMMLNEYGKSLEAIGKKPEAEQVIAKSKRLVADNAALFTRIAWYKYGKNCR